MAKRIIGFALVTLLLGVPINGFLADEGQTISLEERLKLIETELQALKSCSSDACGIHWAAWSSWSSWLHCSGQCNQGYGSREQSRSRTRICKNGGTVVKQGCNGSASETDRRPCNTVELYGCLNGQNTNHSDDVYGLTYNFFDELAQSTCTSVLTSPAHVSAVRRNCYSGIAASCTTICKNLGYGCIDALHVYHPSKNLKPNTVTQTDEGIRGLFMYRYFSCAGSGSCGPNYCCCTWA